MSFVGGIPTGRASGKGWIVSSLSEIVDSVSVRLRGAQKGSGSSVVQTWENAVISSNEVADHRVSRITLHSPIPSQGLEFPKRMSFPEYQPDDRVGTVKVAISSGKLFPVIQGLKADHNDSRHRFSSLVLTVVLPNNYKAKPSLLLSGEMLE